MGWLCGQLELEHARCDGLHEANWTVFGFEILKEKIMAGRPHNISSLLVVFAVIFLIAFSNVAEGLNHLRHRDCKPRCGERCKATSHKKPCMFYCLYCCKKCLCVPEGTYGNKQTCPCYNNWKTKEGRPKCP